MREQAQLLEGRVVPKHRKTRRAKERAAKRWARLRELTQFGWRQLPDHVVEQAKQNYDRAVACYHRGALTEAVHFLEQSLRLSPQALPALLLHANVLRQLKRYEEAIASLTKAAELHSSNADVYRTLGEVLEQTGQKQGALEAYQKALAAVDERNNSPDWVEAIRERCAKLEAELQERRIAAQKVEQQREIEQYMHLASVYEESGFPRRARDYLEKALEIDPDNPEVLFRLGRVELELGNYASADGLFERLLSQHPRWAAHVEKLKREMAPRGAEGESSIAK